MSVKCLINMFIGTLITFMWLKHGQLYSIKLNSKLKYAFF